MVFSVGKRLAADVLTLSYGLSTPLTFNSNTSGIYATTKENAATNLRKIFTVTIDQLSWQWSNLTSDFGATCEVGNSSAACLGLHFPLANTSTTDSKQMLVAGASTLSVLPPFSDNLASKSQRLLPLATIRESPLRSRYNSQVSLASAGDPLLLHNIRLRNWTETSQLIYSGLCIAPIEDRINSTLNNHLYNEHGLQPAYTAVVFFLFENAVVRDVIPLDKNGSAITLDFKHNVQHIAVWLSAPDQSVWLTLAGCDLLVVGLAAAMLETVTLSKTKSDSLAKITAPQVIARVMLDEGQFPPLLLHRHIMSSQGSDTHRKIDQFAIASLGVQHEQDRDRLAALV